MLTIADAGGGTFSYVADYSGMQPVVQSDGSSHRAKGIERGTLTPAGGGQFNRQADDSGLTTTVTDTDGTSRTYSGTGTHSTPPVTYTCTAGTLQFVYVNSQEADNYRRG